MLNVRHGGATCTSPALQGLWDERPLWTVIAGHPAEAVAVIEGQRRWNWGTLRALAEAQARHLAGRGVGRGDVVGVQLPNGIHLVVALLALVRLGAVYHPLNPAYRLHDLSRIFALSRPKLYLHPRRLRQFDYGPMVAQLGGGIDALAVDVDGDPSPPHPAPAGALPDPESLGPDDLFLMGATSGSTGAPKLFVHTQNTQKNEARVLCREFGLHASDRFLATAPLTHRGALMFGLMTTLVCGACLVALREYRADEVLAAIDEHGITAFMAIPAQVSDLLELIEKRRGGAGRSLRVIMVSGAPVPTSLVRRLKAALPECTPVTGYGTSETGYSTFTRPSDDLAKLQTCGRPMPGMELRIAGDGEIQLRGAFVFCGYHGDEAATRAALGEDGWFRTGDLGALDPDGYLLVTGRQKNVIIRSGLKIQAEEIEHLVAGHPDVRQCALVPVPDERLGERACLVVVPQPGRRPVLSDMLALLEERGVAKFKWPELISLAEALPINAVGKLDRIELRKQLAS